MRSLRILWGFALAGTAWALVALCLLIPVRAQAEVPQAPPQQTVLTVAAANKGDTVSLTGALTANGKGIGGATVNLALDGQPIGNATTGGNGDYSGSTKFPDSGTHVVTATFAGDKTNRPAAATVNFSVTQPTSAPATTAAPATVVTAQLAPNPVAAGGVLVVTGNLTSGGVPIDSARVDISCDFGATTLLGVTDAGGNFSANLSLPGAGQPAKLTVTVTYAGDSRFSAAKATFQAAVTAAPPSATDSPTTAVASTPPPTPASTPSAVATSGAMNLQNPSTPVTTFEIVLAIVGAGSVTALCVLWVLAWRRHYLLPGERRGFGSDFGRRPTSP